MTSRASAVAIAMFALLPTAASAHAQAGGPLTLHAPRVLARGVAISLRGSAPPGARIAIDRLGARAWRQVRETRADRRGRFSTRYRAAFDDHRVRLRARLLGRPAPPATSRSSAVRLRDVSLAAVGDINLGDGPAAQMRARGLRWPWLGVARALRAADVAFGNLECPISRRGTPVPKQFRFRGSPAALRVAHTFAGLDVLNLANNHTGDYGWGAFLDTIRYVRRFDMVDVGAGANLARAARPRVITRLGLRIGFVGFSQILPASFFAGRSKPGTVFASPGAVRAGVRAAGRRADVVIATFHWGIQLAAHENAIQRQLARTALAAGADAVIGAHPHVLQPIVRPRRHRLIAYSMGNFIFSMGGGPPSRTGILTLRLSTRGVESAHLRRATIVAAQPRFT